MIPAVSVIVAVYNSERFLARMVQSLVKQTLREIEILLIDDGSTDSSGRMCDEYAAMDSRIRVFHRENRGVADTRQFGLENVTGRYVIHADPDDWMEEDMLEKMYAVAEKEGADMVVCDCVEEYPNRSVRKSQNFVTDDTSKVMRNFIDKVSVACWDKLVRVDTVRKYRVSFVKGVDIGEDRMFVFRLIEHPLKVAYCPRVAYHYDKFINGCSYTHLTSGKVQQRVRIIQTMRENVTTDGDRMSATISEILTAVWAMRANSFTADEFREVFGNLKGEEILNTPGIQFYLRVAVWMALYVNYRLAQSMVAFKYWYRVKIKKLKDRMNA